MPPAPLDVIRHGPLYEPRRYPFVKDPSPVFDGERWHIFATGCIPPGAEIMHLTAPTLDGEWQEEPPPAFRGVDRIVFRAAPGVIVEGARMHLFLQEYFSVLGGRIEHLVSDDQGNTFVRRDTALKSRARAGEAGIYDPDPAEIDGHRYLTYAAMLVAPQPDLFLARSRSGTWDGPWKRLGCIVDHGSVPGHNQRGSPNYECGLEGPQLLELPGTGVILLTAVCFLAGRQRGHRQRLFLAVADDVTGPYTVLGTVKPMGPDGAGETGHGTAVLAGGLVHLVYQERAGEHAPWRFMRATIKPEALAEAARATPGVG